MSKIKTNNRITYGDLLQFVLLKLINEENVDINSLKMIFLSIIRNISGHCMQINNKVQIEVINKTLV